MPDRKNRRILITGGARSGKSRFALRTAAALGEKKLFIATAQALDDEMKQRIESHKRDRGPDWDTLDEPLDLAGAIRENCGGYDVILADCITLWLTNVYLRDGAEKAEKAADDFVNFLAGADDANIVIVTNEVGFGIVPENAMAREFRDVTGFANQRLAEVCDDVYLVVCGIPAALKKDGKIRD